MATQKGNAAGGAAAAAAAAATSFRLGSGLPSGRPIVGRALGRSRLAAPPQQRSAAEGVSTFCSNGRASSLGASGRGPRSTAASGSVRSGMAGWAGLQAHRLGLRKLTAAAEGAAAGVGVGGGCGGADPSDGLMTGEQQPEAPTQQQLEQQISSWAGRARQGRAGMPSDDEQQWVAAFAAALIHQPDEHAAAQQQQAGQPGLGRLVEQWAAFPASKQWNTAWACLPPSQQQQLLAKYGAASPEELRPAMVFELAKSTKQQQPLPPPPQQQQQWHVAADTIPLPESLLVLAASVLLLQQATEELSSSSAPPLTDEQQEHLIAATAAAAAAAAATAAAFAAAEAGDAARAASAEEQQQQQQQQLEEEVEQLRLSGDAATRVVSLIGRAGDGRTERAESAFSALSFPFKLRLLLLANCVVALGCWTVCLAMHLPFGGGWQPSLASLQAAALGAAAGLPLVVGRLACWSDAAAGRLPALSTQQELKIARLKPWLAGCHPLDALVIKLLLELPGFLIVFPLGLAGLQQGLESLPLLLADPAGAGFEGGGGGGGGQLAAQLTALLLLATLVPAFWYWLGEASNREGRALLSDAIASSDRFYRLTANGAGTRSGNAQDASDHFKATARQVLQGAQATLRFAAAAQSAEIMYLGALWQYSGDLAAPLAACMCCAAGEAAMLVAKLPRDAEGRFK